MCDYFNANRDNKTKANKQKKQIKHADKCHIPFALYFTTIPLVSTFSCKKAATFYTFR